MPTSWTIGSATECDLRVDQPKVSGRHCRLTVSERGYVLEDLKSTNGTHLNGVRIVAPVVVTRGDAITLGLVTPMPWPEETAGAVVWLRVGREADNDFVVAEPVVSGHHARVGWERGSGRFFIEDLGSANGTAVGVPERRVDRAAVTAGEVIYLGNHPVPAIQLLARLDPSLVPTVPFRQLGGTIGRSAECDLTLDFPIISGQHARVWREGGVSRIKDLNSANGTFVNGRRIDVATVAAGDLISFGSYTFRLAHDPVPEEVPAGPVVALPTNLREPANRGWVTGLGRPGVVAGLIAQSPVLALGIVALLGMAGSARGVESVLFAVSVAVVWLGLSSMVALGVLDRDQRGGSVRADSVVLATVVALVQATLVWGIVAGLAGTRGFSVASLALVVLGASVGVALGTVVVVRVPRRSVMVGVCVLIVVGSWLLGGGPGTLPRVAPSTRVVASVVPSRWIFEGLLLLESQARAADKGAQITAGSFPDDLAQDSFPADTDRMGLTADLWAVGLMLVGLVASVGYLVWVTPVPASRTAPQAL